MPIIKIAIIGSGKISEKYIAVIKKFKNLKISAIVSKREKNCKKKAKNLRIPFYSTSIDYMMKTISPDIVIVCVTPSSTIKVCHKIFKYNCLSLIEKPIGLNLTEAKKIVNMAKFYNRNSFVALNRRFYSSTALLEKKILKFKKSKRVVHIIDQENTINAKKNGHDRETIKNWMFANSVHLIDYFKILCRGNIKNIRTKNYKIGKKQQFKLSIINFSSGDIGIYQAYWNRIASWHVSVSSANSFFYLSPIETLYEKKFNGKILRYNNTNVDKKFKPGFYLMIKNLIKQYKFGKSNLITLQKNLDTVKLIEKIYLKNYEK
jgi:predicted dehydrogenase